MDKLNPTKSYNEIRIKSSAALNEETVKEIMDDSFIKLSKRSDIYSYDRVNKENIQMKKMSTLFSVIFVCLSLLTMYTSMKRLVDKQKIVIGTMKAIGISKKKIRLHYALYGFIIPILGSLLGLLLGRFLISPKLLKVKKTTITIPNWQLVHSIYTYLLIVVIALICMQAAVFAVNRVLKGMPAETMRNSQKMDIKVKKMWFEKINFIGNKISYYWRWVLRDISRNKIRFIMGVIGVIGGMVLLVAGLGGKTSINKSNNYVFEKQFNYDTKAIILNPKSVDKIKEEKQLNFETEIDIELNNDFKKSMLVVCEKSNLIKYFNSKDEEINIENEDAVITKKLAKDLNIKVGDKIKIRPSTKEWKEIKISNITKNLTPQGIVMSKKYYENYFGDFIPNIILVNNMSEEKLNEIEGFTAPISKERQILCMDELVEGVNSIVKLLMVASILLTVVILYNLGTLNFIEKKREYATLKVLGFSQKEIRGIVIRDCILTILIGWILGFFISISFLKLYVKTISFDNFEWIAFIDYKLLGICSIIVILTSIIINLIMSFKVRKISMVESLKSVE